jgi:hypothetical protein
VSDVSSTLIGGTAERPQTINANHMDMCKFYGEDDDGYRKVGGELRSLMLGIQRIIEKGEKSQ